MVLRQYKEIKSLIIENNKYPMNDNSMHDIVKKVIRKYYYEGKEENRYRIYWDVNYLGDKTVDNVEHRLYLFIIRDIGTGEYIVSTIKYISDNKDYNCYDFTILDKEDK